MRQTKTLPSSKKTQAEPLFQCRETEVEFSKWWRRNTEKLADFEKCPGDSKTLLYALSEFYYERVNRAWDDTRALTDKLLKIVEMKDSAAKNARLAVLLEEWPKIEAYRKRQEVLAIGRLRGVKVRQEKAQKNNADLNNAIAALFDKPDKPGWGWTNQEIIDFLAPRFAVTYSQNTVAKAVKHEAAKFRAERKEQQASQFPKR